MCDWAQQSGIKRTLLLKKDLAAGRHFHHGEEVGYVLEGSAVIEIDGQPPLTAKAGDTYAIEAGKIHDAKAIGDKPANREVVESIAKKNCYAG